MLPIVFFLAKIVTRQHVQPKENWKQKSFSPMDPRPSLAEDGNISNSFQRSLVFVALLAHFTMEIRIQACIFHWSNLQLATCGLTEGIEAARVEELGLEHLHRAPVADYDVARLWVENPGDPKKPIG